MLIWRKAQNEKPSMLMTRCSNFNRRINTDSRSPTGKGKSPTGFSQLHPRCSWDTACVGRRNHQPRCWPKRAVKRGTGRAVRETAPKRAQAAFARPPSRGPALGAPPRMEPGPSPSGDLRCSNANNEPPEKDGPRTHTKSNSNSLKNNSGAQISHRDKTEMPRKAAVSEAPRGGPETRTSTRSLGCGERHGPQTGRGGFVIGHPAPCGHRASVTSRTGSPAVPGAARGAGPVSSGRVQGREIKGESLSLCSALEGPCLRMGSKERKFGSQEKMAGFFVLKYGEVNTAYAMYFLTAYTCLHTGHSQPPWDEELGCDPVNPSFQRAKNRG